MKQLEATQRVVIFGSIPLNVRICFEIISAHFEKCVVDLQKQIFFCTPFEAPAGYENLFEENAKYFV